MDRGKSCKQEAEQPVQEQELEEEHVVMPDDAKECVFLDASGWRDIPTMAVVADFETVAVQERSA